jgi:outer membrane beta-barrel protein
MIDSRKHLRTTVAALALAGAFAPTAAHALQGGEDPALLPVLVDKRFGAAGRHQLGVLFSTALAAKFVEGSGVTATYGYNFSDMFGAQLHGGFILSSESNIAGEVRCKLGAQEPPISDLGQFQWAAGADITFVPFYGKMSFASEFDPSWDFILSAGGGVAGVRSQNGITESQRARCPDSTAPVATFASKVSPTFDFGLGLRFYFNKLLGLRIELKDYFYPDPAPNEGGLTFNLHFQVGLQLAFGG